MTALGLEAVYDLRDTTGPAEGSLTKALPADAGALPAGTVAGGTTLTTSGNGAFNGWDLSGYNQATVNNITASYTDVLFKMVKNAPGTPILQNSFGYSVNNTFTRVSFDGTNACTAAATYQTMIELRGPATFSYCNFLNIPKTGMNMAYNMTMSYCFFSAPAQKAVAGVTHAEPLLIDGGVIVLDHCLFDPGVQTVTPLTLSGTGPFVNPLVAAVDMTISNCIILVRNVDIPYTMQVSGATYGANLTFSNCVLQAPINPNTGQRGNGYVLKLDANINITFINCVDVDTAQPVTSALIGY